MILNDKYVLTRTDEEFRGMAKHIIGSGTDTDDVKGVRTKWADGSQANSRAVFCTHTRYDLQKEFPILGLRKMHWKGAIKELLWIWVKNSNNIKDLGLKIWDQWADDEGSIGKAYGYQLGRKIDFPEGKMTQVERLLYLMKEKPGDRRMVATIMNMDDLKEMGLIPCAHTVNFMIKDGKLNLHLEQRSGDFLAASGPGGFNEVQYAVLCHMFAHVSGLEVGEFVHTVVNHHIYDRHIPEVLELLDSAKCQSIMKPSDQTLEEMFNRTRNDVKTPMLKINRDVKDFFDFKPEDFELVDYDPLAKSNRFEIAE